MENNQEIYQEKGFENRIQYLHYLADEHDVAFEDVAAIASMLGRSEDFDGLVSAVEDLANQ